MLKRIDVQCSDKMHHECHVVKKKLPLKKFFDLLLLFKNFFNEHLMTYKHTTAHRGCTFNSNTHYNNIQPVRIQGK